MWALALALCALAGEALTEAPGWGGPQFRLTTVGEEVQLFGAGPIAFRVRPDVHLGVQVAYAEGDTDLGTPLYVTAFGEWSTDPARRLGLAVQAHVGGGALLGSDLGFAVVEPVVLGRVRVTRHWAVALGGSYRAVIGGPRAPDDLSAAAAIVALEYGDRGPLADGKGDPFRISGMWTGTVTWLGGHPLYVDGGGTRVLLLGDRLEIGAAGGIGKPTRVGGYRLTAMFGGLWVEWHPWPGRPVGVSLGGPVGFGLVGSIAPGESAPVGSAALHVAPYAWLSVTPTPFARVSVGAGFEGLIGAGEVPGVGAIGLGGPALAVRAQFGPYGTPLAESVGRRSP